MLECYRLSSGIGGSSERRFSIVSSNNGANKVSTSLRVRDIGSAEESGKFRRLIAGPKQLCLETITLSSGPKLICSEAIRLSPGFALKYTKAIPVESAQKERRDKKTENKEPQE